MLSLETLPSLRKQHLLSEFAGLKQACPEGIFVTLAAGDPTLWSAVLFVRHGPYAQAVIRFQISFPDSFPELPPLILFSTDIFHPLITPLTTYMYTTDIQDNGTVSARDDERLPPGGFSLRHGFPEWFGRGSRNMPGSRQASGDQAGGPVSEQAPLRVYPPESENESMPSYVRTSKRNVPIYGILKYIRSAFADEELLDSLPLEAAGNPGAWHAWQTHRRKLGKSCDDAPAEADHGDEAAMSNEAPLSTTRPPGEWKWDGVWEDRVKKGIAVSLSEAVLFGGSGAPEELIRFLAMDDDDVESVKENLRRTLASTA